MAGVVSREAVAGVRHFSFADLEAQGREIIARAEAEAARIVAEAGRRTREEAARERERAYREGLEEGRRAGLEQAKTEALAAAQEEARARFQHLSAALEAVLSEFEENKRRLIAAAESELIELALAVARRVCKLEAGRSTESARANARALLALARHGEDAELYLHPAEYELLQDSLPELVAHVDQLEHVTLRPDPQVGRGGCILRTRVGEIDARLETQLDRVAEALCGAAERGALPPAFPEGGEAPS